MMPRILIIGAGIVGAAIADRVSPQAHVTIIDADTPGQGTSASSLAWLNANKTLDPHYFALRLTALREWAHLAEEFGKPAWYVQRGNLTWSHIDGADELSARVKRLNAHDYPARLITAAEAQTLEPALAVSDAAVVAHFPGEGFIHGRQAVQDLSTRAQRAGARLIVRDPVVGLNVQGNRIVGVRLASAQDIAADITICAAGWRTPQILATAGLAIPLLNPYEPGSAAPCLVATTSKSTSLRGLVHAPGIYARPAWGGGLLLEASDIDAAIDMTTPIAKLDAHGTELLTRAQAILPKLNQAKIADLRVCVRPLPIDNFPLVGWLDQGLYVAVTHSGITLAPGLARLITQEITTGELTDHLAPYRPDRGGYPDRC
ncbi:NAD(P)/FAD-dependent oxidoreductase [Actinomadura viridis]|uniref:NAD(P)/FAD-dependent oxidoreductase n=1 Tax=Actinomadura viridis TaxID=58110 RepID=UPI003675C3FB